MSEKITISTNEYEKLKDDIHKLELEISIIDKDRELLQERQIALKESINYLLTGITSMERIFQWKKIVKAVKEHLSNEK